MDVKFYICERCKNIITYLNQSAVPVMCCGQKMEELVPGTTDAAQEKHVPVIAKDGNVVTVSVGSVAHPMMEAHYIQWIVLQTKQGVQRKMLTPDSEPKAVFSICDGDEVEAAYAYCNLHSLWKA